MAMRSSSRIRKSFGLHIFCVGAVLLGSGCALEYPPKAPDYAPSVTNLNHFSNVSVVEQESSPLQEFKSEKGVLTATLVATEQKVQLGSVTVDGQIYNDSYAGPILRAKPGDVMKVTLVNHLSEPTNLHFHGMHSSPLRNGDNMHLVVDPGTTFEYEVDIPPNQPPGLYWVHSHIHGRSEVQINNGISATIVVEGIEKQLPQIANLKERIFVLKDYQLAASDDPEVKYFHKLLRTINGQVMSSFTMHPGETQFWRFTNQSANLINTISLKGHKFRVVATDGVVTNQETLVDKLDILPASRVEVLVDAGDPGTYDLVSEHTLTGSGENSSVDRVLGHVTVAGETMTTLASLNAFPDKIDLRTKKIDAKRTITLSQSSKDEAYFVDGKKFDHMRVDTRVPLGNIEEWTIKNDTDDMHTFHIHQIHFQVVEINGKPQPFEGFVDNIRVPERGEVKLILPFTEPQIVGTFMYHCHVLKHEDAGMMATIEVYDPKQEPSAAIPSAVAKPL